MKHTSFPATHLQGTKSSQLKWSVCNRMPEQALEAIWVTHFGAERPPSWRPSPRWGNTGAVPQSGKQKRQFSLCFLTKDNGLFMDNTSWRGHYLTSYPRSSRALPWCSPAATTLLACPCHAFIFPSTFATVLFHPSRQRLWQLEPG